MAEGVEGSLNFNFIVLEFVIDGGRHMQSTCEKATLGKRA